MWVSYGKCAADTSPLRVGGVDLVHVWKLKLAERNSPALFHMA